MRPVLMVALLNLTACSDATAPGARITGTWIYSASFFSAGNQCNATGIRMTFAHNGRNFSGSTTGGNLNCIGGPPGGPLGNFQVVGGRVSGDSVSFELQPLDWSNSGVMVGNSITGTAVSGTGVDTRTGTFSALRQ